MSDETNLIPKISGIKVAPGTSELAPFIYSDGVVTFGVSGGMIQIELAANTVVPDGAGIRTDVVVTAHLRCSPGAARQIQDSIARALEMSSTEPEIHAVPYSKPT